MKNEYYDEVELLMDMNEELRDIHLDMDKETNMMKLANLYYKASKLLKESAEDIDRLRLMK